MGNEAKDDTSQDFLNVTWIETGPKPCQLYDDDDNDDDDDDDVVVSHFAI